MIVDCLPLSSNFMKAYKAYEPFADPSATAEMDQAEFEAWMSGHDRAAAQLAAVAARSARELALKLEAAVELVEANAISEHSTLSDTERRLLRACLNDVWSLAGEDIDRQVIAG